MKYAAPRGTHDILPAEVKIWQKLEATCREVFSLYNYQEIRTPIFEAIEVFTRSIGTTTDIVSKEMYEFKDRKGRSLCLRPEETAPVVRAALENNLISPDQVTKLYYIGPMFRYERPQAGRQRQFHQAGVEVFGSSDPMLDAEVILLNLDLFKAIGLKDLEININSVGCKNCRPKFQEKLKEYFKGELKNLCEDCKLRFKENPLRILDCKEKNCQPAIENAPAIIDFLCSDCHGHFKQVNYLLDLAGVKFKDNKRLVRGLDYYTKTTFEIVSSALGAQNAVSGGGRYDNLVKEFGGKDIAAVGFAIGLERVIEITQSSNVKTQNQGIHIYIATMGEEAKKVGFDLLQQVRAKGISADMDYQNKSLKSQMKAADKMGAKQVYIIGDEELKTKIGILKDMETGEQKEVSLETLLSNLA